MQDLLHKISDCEICSAHLPLGPRPVVFAHPKSKVIIIGQAPGTKVHASGIPWDDASGQRLRKWMDVDKEEFYDVERFSIMPMGFCYPGRGKSGDLPPRPECAPTWHQLIFDKLPKLELILLIGSYAQGFYLPDNPYSNLTETVKNTRAFLPKFFCLPHPSPRNNIWLKKNPWFEQITIPLLRSELFKLR
ncbi:MAG: uracil-DNA glycosylase family protein [Flavobacteriales bacterium]|nr:uracil-DNA glycosylase family protein [Flavobacteriales bacterium]